MSKLRVGIIAVVALSILVAVPALAGTAGFQAGTPALPAHVAGNPEAVPYESGLAIPLKADRPAWMTPEIEAELDRNGQAAAPVDAPLPSQVGIRPGSEMVLPVGCTMNFIFQKSGVYAIGTAGHCVKVGDDVTLLTLAPGTENPVLVRIGKTLVSKDAGVGNDFALVAIRPELQSWVFPTIAGVGGPCGAFYGSGIETVWHYGHGLGIGTGGTPRAGYALGWKTDSFGWGSPAIYGDSGSPVRVTDLKAAGNLTHLLPLVGRVPSTWMQDWAGTASVIGGTRIGKMLLLAKGYSLVNSPLCV